MKSRQKVRLANAHRSLNEAELRMRDPMTNFEKFEAAKRLDNAQKEYAKANSGSG